MPNQSSSYKYINSDSSIRSDPHSSQTIFDGSFKQPQTEHVITVSPLVYILCIFIYKSY